MKKVLVIGSSGMLGQELVFMLREKNFDVVTGDLSTNNVDITNYENIKKYIEENKPDSLVNCAAYTDVNKAEENPDLANAVNNKGVKNLSEICKQLNIDLIHISTDYVFGENRKEGYLEDYQDYKPLSIYAKTKMNGEKSLIKVAGGLKGSDFNIKSPMFFIVRTSWLFGKNAKNFIEKITQYAKELPELKVVTDEIGCPTYTKDLCESIMLLLEDSFTSGIYHCCSSNSCSRYDFAKKILELQNIDTKIKKCKLVDFQRKAVIPNLSIMKNSKLPKLRTWEEMLIDYLRK